MASTQYATITDIKAERADAGLFLRWVREKKAWYQSDPTAVNADDNDAYLQPTVGVGRWVKQLAVNLSTNGLTWQDITTDTSAAVGYSYFCDTTAAALTITLPATALKGSIIKIHCTVATTIANKVIINPNGRLINSIAGNREMTTVNDFVELTYISDALGWAITGYNVPNVLKISTTSYTVATPGTLPSFTGFVDYLGKQKNTVSWQNPTSGANSRTIRMQVYADNNASVVPTNIVNQVGGAEDIYIGDSSVKLIVVGFDFLTGLVRPTTMMIGITNTNSRWATRPRNIIIYGANTLDATQLIYSPNVSNSNGNGSLLNSFPDLKRLAFLTGQDLASDWTLSAGCYYRLLTINAADYYRYILIQYYGTSFSGANAGYLWLSEAEFYGDIVAP